jgi:hypothetical protein
VPIVVPPAPVALEPPASVALEPPASVTLEPPELVEFEPPELDVGVPPAPPMLDIELPPLLDAPPDVPPSLAVMPLAPAAGGLVTFFVPPDEHPGRRTNDASKHRQNDAKCK